MSDSKGKVEIFNVKLQYVVEVETSVAARSAEEAVLLSDEFAQTIDHQMTLVSAKVS